MERRIVVRESPDWTRRCIPRLEADGHPTEPGAPDPATTMLIMLDISSGEPVLVRRLLLSNLMIIGHIVGRVQDTRRLTGKEVLLQHVGQAGDSDAEEPDPSGGVDRRQQPSGDRADDICAIRCTE